MKTRILTNWKSSLIGLLIAAVSIAAVVFKYATWEEAIGFLTLSGLLTWVKDTIFKV